MRLRELRAILEPYGDDVVVILSKDAEGNGYSPLSGIALGAYNDGQFGLRMLTPEKEAQGYCEDDVVDGLTAICLWPE